VHQTGSGAGSLLPVSFVGSAKRIGCGVHVELTRVSAETVWSLVSVAAILNQHWRAQTGSQWAPTASCAR
jgi:hypothetical protein